MIARIWHGMVPVSKGDEYLDLMRRIALPEYLATRGNRGAWCLQRAEADVTHFEMLTFWEDPTPSSVSLETTTAWPSTMTSTPTT